MTVRLTEIFLVVLVIVIAIYDVIMAANDKVGDTISEVIWGVIQKHPIIAFAAGVVCGHLFWQQ